MHAKIVKLYNMHENIKYTHKSNKYGKNDSKFIT